MVVRLYRNLDSLSPCNIKFWWAYDSSWKVQCTWFLFISTYLYGNWRLDVHLINFLEIFETFFRNAFQLKPSAHNWLPITSLLLLITCVYYVYPQCSINKYISLKEDGKAHIFLYTFIFKNNIEFNSEEKRIKMWLSIFIHMM